MLGTEVKWVLGITGAIATCLIAIHYHIIPGSERRCVKLLGLVFLYVIVRAAIERDAFYHEKGWNRDPNSWFN